jgi:endonuclease/exonuclease/phosphatase family metal-dependent hydrolase
LIREYSKSMKIITLNTWGGRVTKELLDFLEKNRDTDVFCFQEIYHQATHVHVSQGGLDPDLTLFDDIEKQLPDHVGYFRPHYLETYGLAVFIRKGLELLAEEESFVHHFKGFIPGEKVGNHARNVQRVTLQYQGEELHIFNFHGLWNGGGKGDSDPRLSQSKKVVEYLRSFSGSKILCGDFNLEPETESLKLIESMPMRNLVKEYGVTSTRTSFYTKEIRFADYILVNEGVEVKDFKVLPNEVSDHSPLLLEIA